MKRKSYIVVLLSSLLLFWNLFKVEANDVDVVKHGDIIDGGFVIVDGMKCDLYAEYADIEEALHAFIADNYNFVKAIENYKGLTDLTNDNILAFNEAYIEYFSTHSIISDEIMNSSVKFDMFYDIYENTYINDRIRTVISSTNIEKTEKEFLLANLLPYNSPYVKEYYKDKKIKLDNRFYSISNAISYAYNYAYTPNTNSYYYYVLGDCANFCSQILEAGYYQQWYTGAPTTGWWHLNNTNHDSSESWRLVSPFVNYFGLYYSSTSHYSFSYNVAAGDVICLDYYNDGGWDHLGFVAQKSSYNSSLGYYDYIVAQHTNNYYLLVSAPSNKWETYTSGKYGIIRVLNN